MSNFNDSDLRDPSPPVPGDKERAAVATRAQQLGRRRHMMQGAGALGVVAVLAVGVAALTAGGTTGGPGGGHIEAASSPRTTDAPASTTVAPPVTTAAATAPAPDTTPTPNASATDTTSPPADTTPAPAVVPSTYTVTGTVSNIPQGVTVTVSLTGSGGSFRALVDGAGHYSVGGVPAGTYDGAYSWESADGSAAQTGRLGGVTISGDSDFSFTLP